MKTLGLVIVLAWLTAAFGFISNLVMVLSYALSNPEIAKTSFLMVLRTVGIFVPPLGAVLGFF